jgi:hypothetical protein
MIRLPLPLTVAPSPLRISRSGRRRPGRPPVVAPPLPRGSAEPRLARRDSVGLVDGPAAATWLLWKGLCWNGLRRTGANGNTVPRLFPPLDARRMPRQMAQKDVRPLGCRARATLCRETTRPWPTSAARRVASGESPRIRNLTRARHVRRACRKAPAPPSQGGSLGRSFCNGSLERTF